jgi:hypothetical protein
MKDSFLDRHGASSWTIGWIGASQDARSTIPRIADPLTTDFTGAYACVARTLRYARLPFND